MHTPREIANKFQYKFCIDFHNVVSFLFIWMFVKSQMEEDVIYSSFKAERKCKDPREASTQMYTNNNLLSNLLETNFQLLFHSNVWRVPG